MFKEYIEHQITKKSNLKKFNNKIKVEMKKSKSFMLLHHSSSQVEQKPFTQSFIKRKKALLTVIIYFIKILFKSV